MEVAVLCVTTIVLMYALAFYRVTVQKVGNLCLSMYKTSLHASGKV